MRINLEHLLTSMKTAQQGGMFKETVMVACGLAWVWSLKMQALKWELNSLICFLLRSLHIGTMRRSMRKLFKCCCLGKANTAKMSSGISPLPQFSYRTERVFCRERLGRVEICSLKSLIQGYCNFLWLHGHTSLAQHYIWKKDINSWDVQETEVWAYEIISFYLFSSASVTGLDFR